MHSQEIQENLAIYSNCIKNYCQNDQEHLTEQLKSILVIAERLMGPTIIQNGRTNNIDKKAAGREIKGLIQNIFRYG